MLSDPTFQAFFSRANLRALADAHRGPFEAAAPFPHVVIDDFLPAPVAQRCVDAFTATPTAAWKHKQGKTSIKSHCSDDEQLHPDLQALIYKLNASAFMEFLERLTGIPALIPDPHLFGGGLHRISSGGFLNIHADFNVQERLALDRRLNLLLYLNPGWREEWGGALELWDRDMNGCVRRVLPVLNRCVVFATTDWAFHGHPEPLSCPDDRTRSSVSMYYYSNGRPAVEVSPRHTTLYQKRPAERRSAKERSTERRPAEAAEQGLRPRERRRDRIAALVRPFVPPALFALVKPHRRDPEE
jgi:Rps23 Pro-64 3,4-dihydroxylase Tpa1-like proline 4-hydroxylase